MPDEPAPMMQTGLTVRSMARGPPGSDEQVRCQTARTRSSLRGCRSPPRPGSCPRRCGSRCSGSARAPAPTTGHPPGVYGAAFVSYEEPGPLTYRELLVARLLDGRHRRVRITDIWVDSVASRDGGRVLWAIPKELAELDLEETRVGPTAHTSFAARVSGAEVASGQFAAAPGAALVRTPFARDDLAAARRDRARGGHAAAWLGAHAAGARHLGLRRRTGRWPSCTAAGRWCRSGCATSGCASADRGDAGRGSACNAGLWTEGRRRTGSPRSITPRYSWSVGQSASVAEWSGTVIAWSRRRPLVALRLRPGRQLDGRRLSRRRRGSSRGSARSC